MSEYSKHQNMVREEAVNGLAAVAITIILAVIGTAVTIISYLA